jgi:RNA polymerase sigma-70 factor (ECF subfamily)
VTQPLDFTRVYADKADYVRRILQRMGIRPADLDDVVQDTFVTIFRLLPGFEGRAALETWIYAVCWRIAARYHRRTKPRDAVADVPASSFFIDGEVGAARMMASLDGVEPRDLDVFVLHEIGGLSITELSDMTGRARGTLRRHVERAKKAIQRALARSPAEPAKAEPSRLRIPHHAEDAPRIYVTEDVCVSHHGHTVLSRWRGLSHVEALEVLYDFLDRAVREASGRLTYMSIIEPDATPPDREARAAISRCIEISGRHLAAAAFLALGDGVFGLLPPVINAAVFLSRTPINTRFFSNQRLAVEWLSQFATAGTTENLMNHVDDMGRLIDQAATARRPASSAPPVDRAFSS